MGKHPSKDCRTVTDVLARKKLVKKYGDVFFFCVKITSVVTAQARPSVIIVKVDIMSVSVRLT